MGAILPFVPRAAATKTTRPQGTAVAAIIIFPGVRYERVGAGNGAGHIAVGLPTSGKPKPARH